MLILDTTGKSLEVILDSAVATNQLPFIVNYVEINTTTFSLTSVSENDGLTNGITAVTILAAPAANKSRQVKFLSIYNADTAASTVTIRVNNGVAFRTSVKILVAIGETLQYTDGEGFRIGIISNGGAPIDATYITQVPNSTLTAEQALSTLSTGYIKVTTGSGVLSSQVIPIPISDGGTNAITATAARTSLDVPGLGTVNTFTAANRFPNGTSAAPSITSLTETGLGISFSAGTMAFSVGGIQKMALDTDSLIVGDGSLGVPRLSTNTTNPVFNTSGDTNTGMGRSGVDKWSIYTAGIQRAEWDTIGFILVSIPTSVSAANAVVADNDYIRRSTSSIRYKHDIQPINPLLAISTILSLRPITYRGKADADQRCYPGFIAEEVAIIEPLLVTYDEHNMHGKPNYVAYDRIPVYLTIIAQNHEQRLSILEDRLI